MVNWQQGDILTEAEYAGRHLSDADFMLWVAGLTAEEADQVREWLAEGRAESLRCALSTAHDILVAICDIIEVVAGAIRQITDLWRGYFVVSMRRLTLVRLLLRRGAPVSVSKWIAWRWPTRWLPGWSMSGHGVVPIRGRVP